MTVQEWLGKDNQLGIDIWEKKYRYNNETFDEWLDRVSGHNETVKQLIIDKKFLFGGRILSNRGLEKQGKKVTYSNCYVIDPPNDSIESIFECASKLARTFSYGGGCGIDISKLAPRGARVRNAAKETTGSVSFMDLYSLVTELIGQNGRRGALMISIDCTHPDLEEFIGIKSDLNRVTKANISVKITDKFMVAVQQRKPFTLEFIREETGEHIVKTVDAYEMFHKLCQMNWDYAEPGMLFWNRIENWNLLSCDDDFHYAGTNPCFAGNMELLTTEGYKTFEELCGTTPEIYNVNGNIVKSKVWCSGEKKTVKVKLAKNDIVCTPEHRFMTIDGEECMAKDLKGKYIMPCTKANKEFDKFFVKCGFIQGDGQLKRLNSESHNGIEVNIGAKDTDIYDLFADEDYTVQSNRAIYVNGFKDKLIELGFSKNILPEREFPSTYASWTHLQKASFLHGCYSANGSVIKNGRIAYKTTCKKFAEQLLETLQKDFDINGTYITTNKSRTTTFKNGEYECRESYDVNIGQYKEITKFVAEINFYQQYKREQLEMMIKSRASYVYNVEEYKTIKVYDFTEPERHWGVVEGYVVHNCAEEPLPPGGSCLLGSINLSEFVTPFKTFDFDDFKYTVSHAIRALNDVLDVGLPLHPLKEQRDSVYDWRQIGLGIMGLADMLIKMDIKYGSAESIDLCDKIGFVMANTALLTSSVLSSLYHCPYPKYNPDEILQSAWLSKNTTDDTMNQIERYGLRNSQLLTIAPTGTLSTMLGISGGIEPIFANYYERKTESLHGHDQSYKVYTPIVKKYMDEHHITDDKDLPDFFVTAQTLDYKDRIDMQAIWQQHIDASISSTVNVPNDFTVEQVEELYMRAWEKGLKGVTIFRDGCKRAGILTTGTDKQEESVTEELIVPNDTGIITEDKLPRGYIIAADDNVIGLKRKIMTGCGSMHVVAMFDPVTGELLEAYLSKGSTGGCQSNLAAVSRLISLSARAGVDVYTIVDQLQSCMACPSYVGRTMTRHDTSKGKCCPDAVGNALIDMYREMQRNISDDDECKIETKKDTVINKTIKSKEPKLTDAKLTNLCPVCGEEIAFEGGCMVCKHCGWSKCD